MNILRYRSATMPKEMLKCLINEMLRNQSPGKGVAKSERMYFRMQYNKQFLTCRYKSWSCDLLENGFSWKFSLGCRSSKDRNTHTHTQNTRHSKEEPILPQRKTFKSRLSKTDYHIQTKFIWDNIFSSCLPKATPTLKAWEKCTPGITQVRELTRLALVMFS